jgi:hypothetical protein
MLIYAIYAQGILSTAISTATLNSVFALQQLKLADASVAESI